MSGDHAPLAPSSAARLVACPGSRLMEALYPQEPDIDTMEGEAAHWGASELLLDSDIALGQVAANGIVLNDEMIDAAEMYAGAIKARGRVGYVETMLRGNGVLNHENYGTPDHWTFDAPTWTIDLDDFKYGHKYVGPKRNWQFMNYGALILERLGLLGDPRVRFRFTVTQPRNYHRSGPIRTWECMAVELEPHFDTMRLQYDIAMGEAPPVYAGPQCDDCSARHDCPAAIAAGYVAREIAGKSIPLIMTPAALSREYRTVKWAERMIVARRKGIEEALLAKMRKGESVPYFAIEHNPGRTILRDDAVSNGLLDVAAAYGVKVAKDAYITPLQMIKAGIPAHVMKMYTHTPNGAAELVEDDGDLAASVFG